MFYNKGALFFASLPNLVIITVYETYWQTDSLASRG